MMFLKPIAVLLIAPFLIVPLTVLLVTLAICYFLERETAPTCRQS